MKNDEYIKSHANAYMQLETPYEGETNIIHFLELLRDKIGFDEIAKKVVNPIGKKIGAYYGCLLLRPGKVMEMDNPENPKILEDFIKAIGGEPVIYAMRNECCGGYITMEDKDAANKRSGKVLANAKEQGAELLVTACPLCLYNLKKNTDGHELPVVYFTELLAQALGVKKGDE
jgi:heterodisulfide reductase subunit B